jgi:hypothetical protein
MTRLGKICVLVIVVLSLLCFLYGLGVYTYSIDWGWSANYTRKDFDQKIASEIDKRKATITELAAAQEAAAAGWKRARTELAKIETTIAPRQLQYTEELARIQGGKDLTLAELEKQMPWLKKDFPGLWEKDPRTGKPAFDSDAAKAYHGYLTKLYGVFTDIKTVRDDIDKMIAKQKELTEQLVGKVDNAGKRQLGLYALITKEQDVQKRAREELKDLKPQYYQERIESQVLRDRQDSLRSRLEQLKNLKTAKK